MSAELDLVQRAINAADQVLGDIERNAEIKVVYRMLCALGWDPVEDIALGFQIDTRAVDPKAGATNAADFVLRDGGRLCAVGEVKHWGLPPNGKRWAQGRAKLLVYQQALSAPCAFLTTGDRWVIFGPGGRELLPETAPQTSARALYGLLAPHLTKGVPQGRPYTAAEWRRGISLK